MSFLMFFRSEKCVTFTDHMDLPLTSWEDMTDWPVLEEEPLIIGISLEKGVEPKDEGTKKALESFRNKFVEQNCHKDDEIRQGILSISSLLYFCVSGPG